MKIKEAEERTGLTRKAIRYYEENGLIHPTQKENGYKDYDSRAIQRLLIIKKLCFTAQLQNVFSLWIYSTAYNGSILQIPGPRSVL